MTRRFIIALMSMLPLAAGADTFDEIMSEVMYNNLTVRAENAPAEAQVEGLYGENTLEAPEVEFSRVWNTESGGENKWSFSVSQSFPTGPEYMPHVARPPALPVARCTSQGVDTPGSASGNTQPAYRYNPQCPASSRCSRNWPNAWTAWEMSYKKAAEAGAETRLDYNKTVLERMAAHRELNTLCVFTRRPCSHRSRPSTEARM